MVCWYDNGPRTVVLDGNVLGVYFPQDDLPRLREKTIELMQSERDASAHGSLQTILDHLYAPEADKIAESLRDILGL